MELSSNIFSKTAYYNYDSDPSLGAVGTINLGVHLPNNFYPIGCSFIMKTPLTDAGGTCTISCGWIETGTNTPAFDLSALMGTSPVNAFSANLLYQVLDLAATFIVPANTSNVLLTIGNEPLTGGSFLLNMYYISSDI